MRVIADLSVIPIGVGVSLSRYVAACQKVLGKSNVKFELHAYGTNIEGEWDEVMAIVKECHETVHALGAPRISTVLKLGTRVDRVETMEKKVKSVQDKLRES